MLLSFKISNEQQDNYMANAYYKVVNSGSDYVEQPM